MRAWRLMPALLMAAVLAACAPAAVSTIPAGAPRLSADAHIPPFARVPYESFSREAAIQIAVGEWRAFGSPVAIPNVDLPFDGERIEGLWQRVGLYWWLGLDLGQPDQGFTGIHDANGRVFPASQDGNYAWSAAFISYLMRIAGAGSRFPYSPDHADYINAARQHGISGRPAIVVTAQPPQTYAPQRGDLICLWRGRNPIRFADLPTSRFPAHCDIVVTIRPGMLDVIGGNVDNAVAMKHIPVTADGHLANPDGSIVDPDHSWFVVLQVAYDR